MPNTALQEALFEGPRLLKAKQLASALMQAIDDLVEDKSEVYWRLVKALADNGAAFTTDEERATMGLEPRDGDGWTASERVARQRFEENLNGVWAHLLNPPRP